MEEQWQAVKGHLERNLEGIVFKSFFRNLNFVNFEAGRLTLSAPNQFTIDRLQGNHASTLKTALTAANLNPEIIDYIIAGTSDEQKIERRRKKTTVNLGELDLTKSIGTQPTGAKAHNTNLNTKYTFNNFVVSDNNSLAFAACRGVADEPGTKYNPLYIHGGVGLGKTHLIQAVGNEILAQHPDYRILYISMETFYKDFIASIQKKLTGFTEKYRTNDVLIIDDIQFLEGKKESQIEFFHTFNELQQNNKQIILASDRPPTRIADLADRLVSRCEQGIILAVQPPSFETRCAILNAKAESSGLNLAPEIIEFIAKKCTSHIRELEGALNKAGLLQMSLGPRFSLAKLEAELQDSAASRPRTTPDNILKATANYFHLTLTELSSESREKHILIPRQIAMYLMKTELSLSYPQIARALKRKDHTTAISSIQKITKNLATDTTLRDQIASIQEVCVA
ncbi:MAG: chromosomal replication initiator protein DnaA [Candidatus Nomurabacteria bacterium]|jgi:chromosomal replication initiator protein|nr:chromosomal replication initiator protein DnaA [Candidatus Nomurabacteria bacterium]